MRERGRKAAADPAQTLILKLSLDYCASGSGRIPLMAISRVPKLLKQAERSAANLKEKKAISAQGATVKAKEGAAVAAVAANVAKITSSKKVANQAASLAMQGANMASKEAKKNRAAKPAADAAKASAAKAKVNAINTH